MEKPESQPKNPWSEYIEKTKDMPPRSLLVEAIRFVAEKDEALDLGAGALHDTKYLLAQGFKHITAVDKENLVSDILEGLPKDRVDYVVSTFENYEYPTNRFDLVNAQYSLPFNSPATSHEVFAKIKGSLKQGGIFAGQFFGTKDEWNTENRNMTFLSREQVEELLSDMEVLTLNEEEKDHKAIIGGIKHWHIFNIIGRKRS